MAPREDVISAAEKTYKDAMRDAETLLSCEPKFADRTETDEDWIDVRWEWVDVCEKILVRGLGIKRIDFLGPLLLMRSLLGKRPGGTADPQYVPQEARSPTCPSWLKWNIHRRGKEKDPAAR